MKRIKKPHPPLCLCSNFFNYLLGIVSPSLLLKNTTNIGLKLYNKEKLSRQDNKLLIYIGKQKRYLQNLKLNCIQIKIELRQATKEEYKFYSHTKRFENYEKNTQ